MNTQDFATPWDGDWQMRLRSRLDALGFGTLGAFLHAKPGVSYVTLAKELGDTNVAAMQLYGEHIRMAKKEDLLRAAAADCLVRFLVEHVKRGWGRGRYFTLNLASALGDWRSVMNQFGGNDDFLNERLDRVAEALKRLHPPDGWIPSGPGDQMISRAFQQGWPEPDSERVRKRRY